MRRPTASAPTTTKQLLRKLTTRQQVILTGRAAAGIWAALRAWGFHDRVILLPANTCYIVLWAVLKSGNRPLMVDIDPLTGNMDVGQLPAFGGQLSAVSDQFCTRLPAIHNKPNSEYSAPSTQHFSKPAAIIPCHMYGLGAPMTAICQWALVHDVKVIEDAALALGAMVEGQPAGSWGDAAVFSFGLGKLLDNQVGGALVTDDAALAREVERVLSEAPVWDERLTTLSNQ
jgi:dTDP-4-amino-4,6-dideoxygalactose transaminase